MEQRRDRIRATYGLVAVAGAGGVINAALGGRVLLWVTVSAMFALIVGAVLMARGVKPRMPESPAVVFTALGLAPFVNDLVFRSVSLYIAVVLGLSVAILGPRLQHNLRRRTP